MGLFLLGKNIFNPRRLTLFNNSLATSPRPVIDCISDSDQTHLTSTHLDLFCGVDYQSLLRKGALIGTRLECEIVPETIVLNQLSNLKSGNNYVNQSESLWKIEQTSGKCSVQENICSLYTV